MMLSDHFQKNIYNITGCIYTEVAHDSMLLKPYNLISTSHAIAA